MRRAAVGLTCLALVGGLGAGCSSDDDPAPAPVADGPIIEDPGPIHVHGLGINPADGALFIATHTGLFRAGEGQRTARRVARRYQDTMAFTVVGPDRFLGSGHPDGREELPPFLGLIETRDAGESWRPLSLQGKVDFHVLRVAGKRVYGFGSDFETQQPRFLASADGGRTWADRRAPEPLRSLAVNPADPRQVVAAGKQSLHVSRDAGITWRALAAPPGLLAWPRPDRLYALDADGVTSVSSSAGRTWQAVGSVDGAPSAFDSAPGGRLLAALHDGTIMQSGNGGVTWTVRSTP